MVYDPKKERSYYKLKSVKDDKGNVMENFYEIVKFDEDLNVISSYHMNWIPTKDGGYHDCQCPAAKFDCRHKAIMKEIVAAKKVDTEQFFNFAKRTFHNAQEI